MTVTGCERLNQLIAWHRLYIGKALEPDTRQSGNLIMRNHLPDHRGIPEDTRSLPAFQWPLAEHLVQVTLIDLHPIAAQHIGHQRRTLILAHRRQLGLIADEQHPTVIGRGKRRGRALAVIHKLHEVVEQTATPESGVAKALIRDHRGLINNK